MCPSERAVSPDMSANSTGITAGEATDLGVDPLLLSGTDWPAGMNPATSAFRAHTLTVTHTLTCPNAHRHTLTFTYTHSHSS